MCRRMISLLLALLMFSPVLAEEFPPYQVTTFSGSLPERLKEPLGDWVVDESRILSSAAIQSNGGEYDEDCYSALVLLDTSEGARLLAAAQPEGLPWQVNDFTHLLRSRRNVSVSIYMDEYTRVPQFSVDYYAPGSLVSDLMHFYKLWQLTGHTDTSKGIIVTAASGIIELIDSQGRLECQSGEGFWMDYMMDISLFPTNRHEALAQESRAESASIASSLKAIMYAAGAHLRKGPTGNADSLGQYNTDVPMVFLGKQEKGAQWPWYQVRIGNTVGWMSSNYIHSEPSYRPIPLGRTVQGCTLYSSAGEGHPVTQLAPGTTFHILTEYKGMYHICIPQDEITWQVDPEGIYGYIPTENVITGASVSALNAQAAK